MAQWENERFLQKGALFNVKSIRSFYIVFSVFFLAASILVLGAFQFYFAERQYKREQEEGLSRLALSLMQGEEAGQLVQEEELQQLLDHMAALQGNNAIFASEEGEVLLGAGAGSLLVGGSLPAGILSKMQESGPQQTTETIEGPVGGRQVLTGQMIQENSGNTSGYLVLFSSEEELKKYAMNSLSNFAFSGIFVLLAGGLLAMFLANRLMRPVRRLNETAQSFGGGNLKVRLPVGGDEELMQLAITFNELANAFESSNISRRNFMGDIAHELRTPMTAIKGFVDGMLDGTIPEEQHPKYLAIVSEEVGRLARLTRNMLDVTRLEAGEDAPNITSFNIWKPVLSVLAGTQPRMEEKEIELAVSDNNEKALYVLADEDFVHQILHNLIDNAIKFSENGGTIAVSAYAKQGQVVLSIKDTGVGVPRETLPFLFDRFYKADKSRNPNVKGAGLGLHICRILVGLMGGRIWAESEPGKGSEFCFSLPASTEPGRGGTKAHA